MTSRILAGGVTTVVILGVPGCAAAGGGGVVSRVSVSSTGRQADGICSGEPAISADGRFVAFASDATNLVPGDTNGAEDVFVRDRLAGVTQRVSVASTGRQGNAGGQGAANSANGRFVAFASAASNLVPGDTNTRVDVFVRDRLAGTTRRVSVGGAGQGNGDSLFPAISADGQFVAFASVASNLVRGDTNDATDVFVRDLGTGVTRRVSVSTRGGQGNANSDFRPAISADGRFVAFQSLASNLAPGNTNGAEEVFVRDLQTGVTRLVSVGAAGPANGLSIDPAISADGRIVAFASDATNLVPGDTNDTYDVFVRDLRTGVLRRVSVGAAGQQGDGPSSYPAISADGRSVAFQSDASNLVPGQAGGYGTAVFVRDRLAGMTRDASVGVAGQANGPSGQPAISADGRSVSFTSLAANLVPQDTNQAWDVFVRDPLLGTAAVDVPSSTVGSSRPLRRTPGC